MKHSTYHFHCSFSCPITEKTNHLTHSKENWYVYMSLYEIWETYDYTSPSLALINNYALKWWWKKCVISLRSFFSPTTLILFKIHLMLLKFGVFRGLFCEKIDLVLIATFQKGAFVITAWDHQMCSKLAQQPKKC